MNFLKHIATAFYKSFYDVKWMAEQRMNMWRAIAYFFVLFFITVLISGFWLTRGFSSKALTLWDELTDNTPDFTMSVQDETFRITDLDQPYRKVLDGNDGDGLLYIDTVTTSSVRIEDVRGEGQDDMPAIVITSKLVKIYDAGDEPVQTEYIKNVPSFTLTKQQVSDKIATFFQGTMIWLFALVGIFVAVFLGLGKLFYLGIVAWLVFVVARADRKPVTYWQVFTIGVHALTVPTLLQLGMIFLGYPIPYVYSAVLLGFMFGAIFYGMKKTPPTQIDSSVTKDEEK
ncbi:MAG: hypothetical protein CO030_01850 [Candidatus Magasanikbacteria bacterium CG_4_9_14_0_2_um_filter_42_11]|uniref:DUF1189 domain-containing protein n=1 Tax=Candidatus Magasanikbacteria bacterium CG_4_9_14_0_2_um_filter_42_11 TaxID=1974643 RepID=A0A2M8FA81_9BACT|nr:MAG: hypothetical protein COU34_04865 [Candidatus Magasanikbacteria bacterium CG10_big_fil_rev_8_21_14_0_10_43_9]PIY92304.1 MAG: hypothetical protein COY70_03965 [Candidatus Magasanikbacteria bacterium CG_4_10_14_0_8_um_filter_42_12]PJC52632.1 MAG: hypothetical protein CO030_01850 [Candidatus Magasanikbacteria bacterium CG_4_9_14_0_2_um_filter_42_11]